MEQKPNTKEIQKKLSWWMILLFFLATILTLYFLFKGEYLKLLFAVAFDILLVYSYNDRQDAAPKIPDETTPTQRHRHRPIRPDMQSVDLPATIDDKAIAYQYSVVHLFVMDKEIYEWDMFNVGVELDVFAEKDNSYDPKAVAFTIQDRIVGYLYKGKHQDMANDWLKRGDPMYAIVTHATKSDNQVAIALAFYGTGKAQSRTHISSSSRAYRLTGNTNEDMQIDIPMCAIGDECDLFYDCDKNRYLVTAEYDIGYLPVSAHRIVSGLYEDLSYSVTIFNIGISSNDKYFVSVNISGK